jgi:hypothetical protein
VFAKRNLEGSLCLANVVPWTALAFHVVNPTFVERFLFFGLLGAKCFPNAFLVEYAMFMFLSLNNLIDFCFPTDAGECGPFLLVISVLFNWGHWASLRTFYLVV